MPPAFGMLEVELLALIFEFVQGSSPRSIASIALVNRHFNATSKIIAYRHREISIDDRGNAIKQVKIWMDDEQVLRGLRHLTIRGVDSNGPAPNQQARYVSRFDPEWDSLALLIQHLGNLKTLIWVCDEPVPLQIIQALEEQQKKARLKVYHWTRGAGVFNHNDPAEIALANSPALTAIRAMIQTSAMEEYLDPEEAALRRIIACAPNLSFASIIRGHKTSNIHNIPFQGSVAERKRQAEQFWMHERPNSALKSLTLDGYPISEETLEDWSRFIDLSSLENLKCSRGILEESFFRRGSQMLKNLQHVALNLECGGDLQVTLAAKAFIATCSPLRSLSLWSWARAVPLQVIVDRHGPTLEALHLHEREVLIPDEHVRPRVTLSIDELQLIKDRCPNLNNMTIDMNRHAQSLYPKDDKEIFCLLSAMQLNKLQVYYNLGISFLVDGSGLAPSEPQNIEFYIKDIWKQVFGAKKIGERALDVKFGEWERKVALHDPRSWAQQEAKLKTYWQVRPEERDDRARDCQVTMKGRERAWIWA